uniref:Uncharacterized protein n=1 Tax=Bradyrhizobium barranii subsp. barranii TaxID=2823807 RepID=A0A7Z0QDY9_9BRAD
MRIVHDLEQFLRPGERGLFRQPTVDYAAAGVLIEIDELDRAVGLHDLEALLVLHDARLRHRRRRDVFAIHDGEERITLSTEPEHQSNRGAARASRSAAVMGVMRNGLERPRPQGLKKMWVGAALCWPMQRPADANAPCHPSFLCPASSSSLDVSRRT